MASPCQGGDSADIPPLLPRGIGGADPASGCQQLGMRLEPACLHPPALCPPWMPHLGRVSRGTSPPAGTAAQPCPAWHNQAGQNPPALAINWGIKCQQLRWDPLHRRVLMPLAKNAWGTRHGLGVPRQGDSPCSSSVTPLHGCWGPGCPLGDRVQHGDGGRPQRPATPCRPVC